MPCAAAVSSVTNPPTTLALAIPIIANIQHTSLDIITQWTMSVHYVNAVMGWKIQQTFQNWHFVFFFTFEQPKVQRPGWKFCHFLGRILFTMPCKTRCQFSNVCWIFRPVTMHRQSSHRREPFFSDIFRNGPWLNQDISHFEFPASFLASFSKNKNTYPAMICHTISYSRRRIT